MLSSLGTSIASLAGIGYLPSSMVLLDGKQKGLHIDSQTSAVNSDLLHPYEFL